MVGVWELGGWACIARVLGGCGWIDAAVWLGAAGLLQPEHWATMVKGRGIVVLRWQHLGS